MTFTDEHLHRLYRYGISLTHNDAQAHDLLQDAIETYLKKPPVSEAASMAYLRRIMRNRFIDQYRHANRFPEESLSEVEETLGIDARLLEDIVITEQQLEMAWGQLSNDEREMLFLWAVEEMSANDIAQELEMPRGTVLSRNYRLRNKFNQPDKPTLSKEGLKQ